MKAIYFDHAATTPLHPEVITEINKHMLSMIGNPSSIHQFGRKGRSILNQVRKSAAQSLNVDETEIIFTSGGTEGDNFAILQTAEAQQTIGRHIITTTVEHPAVLNSMKHLAHKGWEISYLSVNEQGQISLREFEETLREDTILVSVMYGNNETGVLLPIAEIGQRLKGHPAYFHSDAVQAFGSEILDVKSLGVDLLSISGHKVNGPKGTGFLYVNQELVLPPLFHGGEQEGKRRAGTENDLGIAGLGKAIELLGDEEKSSKKKHYQKFTSQLLASLDKAQISYHVNGGNAKRLPHILNLWLKGIPSDLLLLNLDLLGYAVSAGSACTAGNVQPSHVLTAMYGKDHPAIKESIRISFGLNNTEAEIEQFAQALVQTIASLRKRV